MDSATASAIAADLPERPRVLILHPSLRPGGGGEAVAAWMLDALQDTCRLSLATWRRPDFDAVNRWYGTSIRSSAVSVSVVPPGARALVDAAPMRLALLRTALVMCTARRLFDGHDVVISAENEFAVGRQIVQYVHYPRFLRPRPAFDGRWFHRIPGAVRAYWAVCDRLLDRSEADIARNVTLANSAWTAERVRALYPTAGVSVVYPPVAVAPPPVDWERRENGFVCVGRFAGEKDHATVIDIVAAVRREVSGVRLHFAGTRSTRAGFRQLTRLVRPHRSWIEIHEDLSRRDLGALIARHRYGIHGMADEHFGIGPAEMAAAGSIVFMPAGGGQMEIVRGDTRLLYRSREDAVAKILRVIGDAAEQASLRAHLDACSGAFTAERFVRSMREIVAGLHAARLA